MIAQGTMILQGARQDTGELFLWATEESGEFIPPLRLKSLLFAWDSRSFYGTLIETADMDETSGLLLSPYTAVQFLAHPHPTRLATISWSPELLHVQQVARLYIEALANGWFVPSFESWKSGQLGWKLRLPATEELPARTVNDWFPAVVRDLLSQESAVRESFHTLLQEYSILDVEYELESSLATYEWLDEEQWLIAIGWQRDEIPFRTSIQLVEPAEEQESWHLQLLLQDLDNPDLLIETDFKGRPFNGDLPASWQDYVEQRTTQESAKLDQIVPWLQEATFSDQSLWELDDEQAWNFMNEDSLHLIRTGSSVFLPAWWEALRARKPRLKAKITSSVGSSGRSRLGLQQLVDFDWKLAVGDLELTEAEFSRILAEKKRLAYIRGQWIQLDREFLNQMTQTFTRVNKKKGLSLRDVLEMYWLRSENGQGESSASGNVEGNDWDELRIEVELNAQLQEFVDQLQAVQSLPLVTPPPALRATLRHYQQEGVSWLLFLRKYGLGCCLADDMGLGKTIQFITYLLCAKQEQAQESPSGPSLLVCPTSVMGNWEKELQRFAPDLRVHVHYGAHRAKGEALHEQAAAADLVITSYTLAQHDQEELSQIQWDALCLDEAQNIKNAYTKQRIAIRQLDANHRIALTGTPIENRLTELWSIYDFLNPGFLGSLKSFTDTYVNQIERHNDPRLIEQVQKLIRPFLLRRVKKDPAIQLDLPDKNEMKVFFSLTAEQGALYENSVQYFFEKLDTLTGMEKKGLILASLTKLKQICDHPALFLKEANTSITDERSNKLDRLLEMVEELRVEGDQCLIFTQYVEMGHLLQKVLEQKLGESVLFLHGGVPKSKRDEFVARFQGTEGEDRAQRPGIFVLSLKAGGTGLNLTAATHVFHFDRWWNPAVEDQATDRAFRIGQTRDVQVHKFVTLGTLEERIDEMIEHKQGLSRQIVGGNEQWITEMSTQDLKDLFALRTEWIGK